MTSTLQHIDFSYWHLLGDDAQVIIWNLSTGKKMQVISCAFNGAVGAVVWFPSTLALRHRFAFGCTDGSVHIYISDEATVCEDLIIILHSSCINILFKTWFMMVPLWTWNMILNFAVWAVLEDLWLRYISLGLLMVSGLKNSHSQTNQPCYSDTMQQLTPTTPFSSFTTTSIHFCNNGASLLLTTLETHKVSIFVSSSLNQISSPRSTANVT